MTDMALEEGGASLKDVGKDGAKAELETEAPTSCSEPAGARAKDHCDCLLDTIDAQLSQLQWRVSGTGVMGASTNGDASLECSPETCRAAELEGRRTEQDGSSGIEISSTQKEEYGWRLMYLLGCEQTPENLEDQSDSNSICTEDFAARFREGMVEPLVISDGEGEMRVVAFPAEGSAEEGRATGIKAGLGLLSSAEAWEAAAEGVPPSTARWQEDTLKRFEEEVEGELPVALSSSVEEPWLLSNGTRRESLESLGGRISRLSQRNTMESPGSADMGKASSPGSRVPGPAIPKSLELSEESISWPLQQGGERPERSARQGQNLQENSPSFGSPLLVEELGPSQPLGALGARAWDGESQLVGTAWSPSGRRQAECGPSWCESPCHYAPQAPHSSPSLASGGEKSPPLVASLCTTQGLPPELEKSGGPGLALQGSRAAARLTGSPQSVAAVTQEAPGCSPTGLRHTQRDSVRDLGSSSTVTEEEEEGFLWFCGSIDRMCHSPVRWNSVPSRAESSLEGTRKDVCVEPQYAAQELKVLRGALERSQEAETLESHAKATRRKADEARADPLPALEKEMSTLRPQLSTPHSRQLGTFQAEVSLLAAKQEEPKAHAHHLEGSLSSLEHQELEQQLSCCKAELFSAQRAARARIEELQECLEETQNRLEERTAEGTALQGENMQLRLQLRELEKEQTAALSRQMRDVRVWEAEQELRLSALEKLLSEKELELIRLRESVCTLTTEKEAQQHAMESLGDEHSRQLGKMRQEKEVELAQQKEELQHLKRQELQEWLQIRCLSAQLAERLEQLKAGALQDQAASFQKEMENLTMVIKAQDEEIPLQQEAWQLQKESTEQLVRELKLEGQEKLQTLLLTDQRKGEAEKREALQRQRGTMEEQTRRAHAKALEKERTVAVLQNKILELQQTVQELGIHGRSLQREKQEALDELRALLQEEKVEALRQLREELEQERACESDRLRARLQQLEEELSFLRMEQNEMSLQEQEVQSHAEWAEQALAREIGLACHRIQDMLPGRLMAHRDPFPLSTGHALQLLHAVSEETQHCLGALQREMEAQKHAMLYLQEEKEWELRQQREQLHVENTKALETLKERLIQEHLQEIASLQHHQLTEAGDGVQQRPKEKYNALQAVQSTVALWKDGTAHRPGQKTEEELGTHLSKDRPMGLCRSAESLDAETARLSTDWSKPPHLCSSSSSLSTIPTCGQHTFVTLKLLHQLRGRVRELRAENAICRGSSLEDLTALRTEPGQMGREKFHGVTHGK